MYSARKRNCRFRPDHAVADELQRAASMSAHEGAVDARAGDMTTPSALTSGRCAGQRIMPAARTRVGHSRGGRGPAPFRGAHPKTQPVRANLPLWPGTNAR